AKIHRPAHPTAMPFADVSLPVAGIVETLRVKHGVGVEITVHRRRGVNLIVDAVVPVVGARKRHGTRWAADGRWSVRPLEQDAGGGQAIQVRRAAGGASGDGGPLL